MLTHIKLIIVALAIILFIASCNKETNKKIELEKYGIDEAQTDKVQKDNVIEIDCNKFLAEDNILNLTEIIDTASVVILDDRYNESLIGKIQDIYVTDSLIYILNITTNLNISIFRRNGDFVRQLKKGQGPNEIRNIFDFDIDQSNGDLIVRQTSGIYRFNYDGTELIEKQIIPFDFKNFITLDSCYIFFEYKNGNEHLGKHKNKNIIITDQKLKLIQSGVNTKNINFTKMNKCLYKTKNDIKVTIPFNDTIYSVKNKQIRATHYLNFNSKEIDYKGLENKKDPVPTMIKHKGEFRFNGNFIETNTHEYAKIITHGKGISIYRDKRNGKIKGGNIFAIEEQKLPGTTIPQWCYKDYFVSELNYTADMAECKPGILSVEDVQKLKSLNEESNPILIFYRLKNF